MKKITYRLITILCLICLKTNSQTIHLNGGNTSDLISSMSNNSHIVINGDFVIDTNITIPKSVTIDFRSGVFNISADKTVFFNGSLRADLQQIFKGEGKVLGKPKVDKVYPQWWGADGTDNIDDTKAIQAAIDVGIMKKKNYIIVYGEVTVDKNLTVPENVTIDFRSGALNISAGKTVFFNGGLEAGLQHIFKGQGKVLGKPKVDKVYPQWWGADGTDNIDDTKAIQAAIDVGSLIYLSYPNDGTNWYRVHNTLNLRNNITLKADPGVIIRGKFTEQNDNDGNPGGYSNTIINGNNVKNVRIENIIFDFDKSIRGKFTSGTTKPGIHFKNSKNISFENVTLQQFMTNKDVENLDLFAVAVFQYCEDISINKLGQFSIIEEGIRFYDCKNVSLENSIGSTGPSYTTSTFFGFWRCDGVILKNTKIRASIKGGSVVNCYSRNVLIENLRLNEELSEYRGRGIDLANEGQDIEYNSYNIIIRNSYLKCKGYGIQGGIYKKSFGSGILTIENNYIDVKEEVIEGKNTLQGIRIDGPQIANITNNKISLSNTSNSTIGRCILISNNNTEDNDKDVKGIKIENNEMKGLCGIAYNNTSAINLNLLTIKNNLFTSQKSLAGLNPHGGASTFVFIRQLDNPLFFDNIFLENNVVEEIKGGLFVTNGENISFGSVSISRNTFKGKTDGTNCELFIRAQNSPHKNESNEEKTLKSVIRIDNNNFYDPHSVKIYNFDNIFVSNNIFEWTTNTPAPISTFRISNCSKTLNIKDNRIIGAENNLSRYDVENSRSFYIPQYVDISKNVTIYGNNQKKFRINGFQNTIFSNDDQN